MKFGYECGACLLRQACEDIDLSCDDEKLKFEIMNEVFAYIAENFSNENNANRTASIMHHIIKNKTGCEDAYHNEKIKGNELALKYLPKVKEMIKDQDTLENYVKISIIGNMLDLAVFAIDEDIEPYIVEALENDLVIKDIEEIEKSLKKYDKVLYLVDNAGEIVFDRLLLGKIKEYDLDITIAVKSEPILNDACMAEAIETGLDEFGEIVGTGCGTIGYVDSEISEEFREIFNSHEFIISKGMGNYEGFTEIDLSDKDLYYLLCAKCAPVARDIGINLRDMILLKNK